MRSWRGLLAASLAVAGMLPFGLGCAQSGPEDPVPAVHAAGRVLVDLTTLARRHGWSASASGASLTVRSERGILTVFHHAPDALWQPDGEADALVVPLSTPPQSTPAGWFVPEDLLQVLGIEITGDAVSVPGGTAALAFPPAPVAGDGFEVARLGGGAMGLRFFAAAAAGGEAVSMLVADLALLALAVPEQRALLDRLLVEGPMAEEHPLLVTVTALGPAGWEPTLVFEQGDLRFEARYPFRFQLVTGDAEQVSPERPAVGVVLLPARFSLEDPLRILWGGATGEVTFRPGR